MTPAFKCTKCGEGGLRLEDCVDIHIPLQADSFHYTLFLCPKHMREVRDWVASFIPGIRSNDYDAFLAHHEEMMTT